MNITKLTSIAMLLAGLAVSLKADTINTGESPYKKLSSELKTKHISFAKPLTGKPINAFVIAPLSTQRETVELAQRISITPYALMTSSYNIFGPWKTEKVKGYASIGKEEFRQGVQNSLNNMTKCDLIIIGKVPWQILPSDIQQQVLAKIKNGAHLLLIARDGQKPVIPGIKLHSLKADMVNANISAIPSLKNTQMYSGQLGKGTILGIQYPLPNIKMIDWYFVECLTPFESNHILYYDYCQAFLAKCILYLMQPNRAQVIFIDKQKSIRQDSANDSKLSFSIKGKLPEDCFYKYCIINQKNEEIFASKPAKANKENTFSLPILSGGEKIINVYVMTEKNDIIDFNFLMLNVIPKNSISEIGLNNDYCKRGAKLQGKVTTNLPVDGKLIAELADSNGKIWSRQTIKDNSFALATHNISTRRGELTVTLYSGNRLNDSKSKPIYFNQRTSIDDFRFIIWANMQSNSRLAQIALEQIKHSGVDIVMDTSIMWVPQEKRKFIPRTIMNANIAYAPYATRLVGTYKKPITGKYGPETKKFRNGKCRFSLYDEFVESKNFPDKCKKILAITQGCKGLGAAYYNLGDENGLYSNTLGEQDICYCAECQKAFITYLQKNYPSLKKLNEEWDCNFTSWEQAKGLTLLKAWEKKQFPRWLDYRLFMEERFIDYHKLYIAAVKSIDPDARCGIEGLIYPANSFSGFNLYKMLPHFDFFAPYKTSRELHTMKYLNPQALTAVWFGSYAGRMGKWRKQNQPWKFLFKGVKGMAWWTAGSCISKGGLSKAKIFRPDMTFLRHYRDSYEQIHTIKNSGLGKLFNKCKRRIDSIAVHYSNNNMHASTIRPEESTWEQSLDDVDTLLGSIGLDYEFVSPPELESGILEKFKVLFLPYSQAISAKEVTQIKKFVKNGGLLIADFVPGIMDEHGKKLKHSSLQDVFSTFTKMEVLRYDKGKCIYLGDYISGFSTKMGRNIHAGIQSGMLRILHELAGITPSFKVIDEFNNCCSYDIFEDGKAQYLCLLGPVISKGEKVETTGAEAAGMKSVDAPVSFSRTVTFPEKKHVYDILNGHTYLGYVKSFKCRMKPAVGRVFACMPYKIDGIAVTTSKVHYNKGDSVLITVDIKRPKRCKVGWVANYQIVKSPKSNKPEGLKRVFSRNNNLEIKIPIPLNAASGQYSVKIFETVSGRSTNIQFNVK